MNQYMNVILTVGMIIMAAYTLYAVVTPNHLYVG
jgi:hypothetical protein